MFPGTSYGEDDVFDLTRMEPYNLDKLYKDFTKISKELVLYLPRNSDLNQIARYVPKDEKLEVAHYAIMGASKVRRAHRVRDQRLILSRRYARTLATSTSMLLKKRRNDV